MAAEYIAAQFRRAGIESAGDNGYFQTAKFFQLEPEKQGAHLDLDSGGKHTSTDLADATIQVMGPVSLDHAPALKFSGDDVAKVEHLGHPDVEGKVVLFYLDRGFSQPGFRRSLLFGVCTRLC